MSNIIPSASIQGADCVLKDCGNLTEGERIVVVYDCSTRDVADLIGERARFITAHVELYEVPEFSMHGQEPPAEVSERMRSAHLCLGLTQKSMAHTEARYRAAGEGCRYLSLPDYSLSLLADSSLTVNFHKQAAKAKIIAHAFTQGDNVNVTTPSGTAIKMNIRGRIGNCCPGFVVNAGELGSPPDIESNVSPVESDSEGVVVVDGSIPYPGLGRLEAPVTLHVKQGRIVDIDGVASIVQMLRKLFDSAKSDKVYVLAECGIGLNDKASLTGTMLTDEGAYGTMHFGFGSNHTVGGCNKVPFHLDFVFQSPTLAVDGSVLMLDGELQV